MATTTGLLTVEQFAALPRTDERQELVRGEVINTTRPSRFHFTIQRRLERLLARLATSGITGYEFTYASGAANVRVVDVAWMSQERWEASEGRVFTVGAPELIIEILSPSNTAQEIAERKDEAFASGCLEFWVVNPARETTEVSRPDQTDRTYRRDEEIPIAPLGGERIRVDSVFSG